MANLKCKNCGYFKICMRYYLDFGKGFYADHKDNIEECTGYHIKAKWYVNLMFWRSK